MFIFGSQPMSQTLICREDRKSTRLNSSHVAISYAVFCLKKKKAQNNREEVDIMALNAVKMRQNENIYHICILSYVDNGEEHSLLLKYGIRSRISRCW